MRSVKCNSTKIYIYIYIYIYAQREVQLDQADLAPCGTRRSRAQEGPKMAPTHHHSPHATDHLIGYLLLTWVPNPFGGHI